MDCDYIISTQTYSDTLSDHSYVISELRFPSPRLPKIIKSINIDDFQHDIELKSFGSEGDHVDILVDKYNSDLRTVLDSHAPLTHKEVTKRPLSKWYKYTNDLRERKRELRKLERNYISKIDTLRNDHFSQTNIDVVYTDINRCNSSFTAFNEVTLMYVHKLINKSSNKSCFSDPIPTFVVKSCLDTLLIHLVHIINTSLLTAVFPKLLKQSLIHF